jgi:hypothetical protein
MEKTEYAFNFFIYKHQDWVVSVGCAVHPVDRDDAAMLQGLQAAVPRDAILADRIGWSAEQTPGVLPDGTPVVPYRDIELLSQAGKHLQFFEPFLQRYDAPADSLMCLTIVEDGMPMNQAGPIYEQGDPEADRQMRHQLFLAKRIGELESLHAQQYASLGRGCLHCQKQATPSEPERRAISFLPIEETRHTGAFWDHVRTRLHEYDPCEEMLVCLHDGGPSSIYSLKLSKAIDVSPKDD